MDGECIREYWSNEIRALLDTYKQFQVLIPAKDKNGADHNGEDGRYVEILLREYLKRYLAKQNLLIPPNLLKDIFQKIWRY